MSSESVDKLLRKLIRHSNGVVNPCAGMSDNLKNHLFDLQLDILNDPSAFKLLNCGRRFGKSILAAIKITIPCLDIPGVKTCYASTTKSNAKAILWSDLLEILKQYNIPHQPNVVECTISFPNGSKIVFAGLHNKRDSEELRGKKYLVVVIDEAAYVGPHLSYAIDDVLRPTLTDYAGSELWLISTPNASLTGYFYNECQNSESKYKKWTYDYRDNKHMPRWKGKSNWRELAEKQFQKDRDQYEREGKLAKFQREYEAKWVRDTESLLYPEIHTIEPNEIPSNLDYYIGLDIGWKDETAIICVGVDSCQASPVAYVVEEWSQSEVLTSDVAKVVNDFSERYSPIGICADSGGGGLRLIQDISSMYHLNIQAADKPKNRKSADIQLISDLARTKRMFISNNCRQTISELTIMQWNDKGEPDQKFADHLNDALVYCFRQFLDMMSPNEIKESIDTVNDFTKDWWAIELQRRIRQQKDEQELLFGYEEF